MFNSLLGEKRTVHAMIGIYCERHHTPPSGLCDKCLALFDYAEARLAKCPQGIDKPVCASCPVHCYRPEMRDEIRSVMRYAGPRMIYRHPMLALAHLLQKRKSVLPMPNVNEECSAAPMSTD